MSSTEKTSFNGELMRKLLTTRYCGREFLFFEELMSTNFSAKELARVGYKAGTAVICDRQTMGRGRRGRQWLSDPGEGLCMSVILRPNIEAAYVTRYTVAAAVGAVRALKSFGVNAHIKWPNDIVYGGRKLAGILLDCATSGKYVDYVIVGIGVNVNTESFYGDIKDTAQSLRQCTGVWLERARVAAEILNESEACFEQCEDDESYKKLMESYKKESCVLGEHVRIIRGESFFTGVVTGFDELGRAVLCTDEGETKVFDSGDVSLRKA